MHSASMDGKAGRYMPSRTAGRLGEAQQSTKLLPVTLQEPTNAASSGEPGAIHIKLARAQIRIGGSADVGLLRTVLAAGCARVRLLRKS
jgi:hypothetical protein